MTVQHYLIGYDKADGSPRVEIAVPADRMEKVRKLIPLYPDDPDAFDPYELLAWQAREIASMAGIQIAGTRLDFFLQAFDGPEPASAGARDGVPAH